MPKPRTQINHNLILNLFATAGLMVILFTAGYSQVPKLNSNRAAAPCVFLDFDGHVVKGTAWNWDSTIHAKSSGLNTTIITEIFNRVAEDFRIFNLNITTDSIVYAKAPVGKRIRIIITTTYKWYGGTAAGIAFINSFTWGDGTPAWVFNGLLNNNPKYVAEAVSHETGHTLGLQHQSTYTKTCSMVTEYAEGRGTGEIGWAPIMGVGYQKNLTIWTYGSSVEGCKVTQNDITIISKGLNNIGLRSDDHGNTSLTATTIIFNGNNFQSKGIINNAPDRDFFKITLSKKQRLKSRITPNNVGPGNLGANVDLFMTLIKSTGDTIGRYNPKTLLNATFDTVLVSGIYYVGIDGAGNQNVSDYGSVGLYSFSGSLENVTTAVSILLKGDVRKNLNLINWNIDSTDIVITTYLEYSFDGYHFVPLSRLPSTTTTYSHKPTANGDIYYRVRIILPDETTKYSNTISLRNTGSGNISLISNFVQNTVQVRCSGDYAYQLIDESGRLFQKGKLTTGLNNIHLIQAKQGLLLLRIFNQSEQLHFKLIRQ